MDDLFNQPPLRGDLDLWAGDPVLRSHAGGDLSALGARWGTADLRAAGRDAERHPPEARIFDRGGRRLDEVAFHPAWHRLMAEGIGAGYAARPWDGPGGHAPHAAMVYMMSQVEPGVCCPMTMTYAAVPALAADPALAALWRPRLVSRRYDPRLLPVAQKDGATLGMAMTERQGGSDLRGTATWAVPCEDGYLLTGQKWFCSAPMSDGFLTLARTDGGLTCFLVPRWLAGDGDMLRNGIRIQRLKDKLGNRANASAEIAYDGAVAHRLGEEGAGVRTILTMVHHTRLDTAVAPAGLMRAALAEAHHWVAHRSAFGRLLIDQPLMRRLLADLVLDWEGAVALAFRVARAFDEGDAGFARIGVALAKFLNNKLCPGVVGESMEILGGMGFVEDTGLPMLYREAPLNGIWEGSGNVICLDILRTLARDPAAAEALSADLDAARGADRSYDAALALWRARAAPDEADARRFAEETARLLTAATLIRSAPPAVADGYAAGRLGPRAGRLHGTASGLDEAALIARLGPPE